MRLISLLTALLLVGLVACQGKGAPGKAARPLSRADYEAACKVIPVAELTSSPARHQGARVKLTGEVVAFEESTNDAGTPQVHLVLSVEDPAKTLPGGFLPVHVLYQKRTGAFVKDLVTVHGDFKGMQAIKLRSLQEKTMPHVDAQYVEKVPKK